MVMEASGSIGLSCIIERTLAKNNIQTELPTRISDDFLAEMVSQELAFTASSIPKIAAQQIRNAGERMVILPLEHRVARGQSDQLNKKIIPDNYLFLDSRATMPEAIGYAKQFAFIAKKWNIANSDVSRYASLSDRVAEQTGMYPYFLLKAAVRGRKGENPPIGFYWRGNDGRPRATTWMRSIRGHELFRDHLKGDYVIELDKEFYGQNMEARVASKSEDKHHVIRWIDLPIFTENDTRQYSAWRKISTVDSTPDSYYRGKAHDKSEPENIFFTAYAIAVYDACARRLKQDHEKGPSREVQVNPFPILTNEGARYVNMLRTQVIVGRRGLNMTEMDRMIGADTIAHGYDHNFVNWTKNGKKD